MTGSDHDPFAGLSFGCAMAFMVAMIGVTIGAFAFMVWLWTW